MATIAVDIDDTLYPFCDLARQVLTEEGFIHGDEQMIAAAYAPWPEWRSPVDLLGLEKWLSIIERCHDDELIITRTPYEGAVETLWGLVESGHELIYISNRATETESATRAWLAREDFPLMDGAGSVCASLVVTSEAKKPYIAHCPYLIDDRPKTIIEFLHDGDWHTEGETQQPDRRVFSLAKEFNRSLTDVPGVYLAPTWFGIRHYLVDKGILKDLDAYV